MIFLTLHLFKNLLQASQNLLINNYLTAMLTATDLLMFSTRRKFRKKLRILLNFILNNAKRSRIPAPLFCVYYTSS